MASGVRGIVAFLHETPFLDLEIYRLMTILESSSTLADQTELTIAQRMVAARLGRIISRRKSKLYLSPKASSGRLMGHPERWASVIKPSGQPVGLQGQYAMLFGPVAKCNKCA